MALELELNGQTRSLDGLEETAPLAEVISALDLKADRVAVEHNGEIVARSRWASTRVRTGDKLEVVHFVGGGSFALASDSGVHAADAPFRSHEVVLQAAGPGDLAEIVELANRAYRGQDGWSTEAGLIEGDRLTLDSLRSDLTKPAAHLLVVRDAAGLAGSVWLEPQGRGDWYLGLLTVRPDLQGQHMGRSLLAAAEDFARAAGARRILLTVLRERAALLAWYQRRGYRGTGVTTPFPVHDPRFGRALHDSLTFVELEKSLTAPAPAP